MLEGPLTPADAKMRTKELASGTRLGYLIQAQSLSHYFGYLHAGSSYTLPASKDPLLVRCKPKQSGSRSLELLANDRRQRFSLAPNNTRVLRIMRASVTSSAQKR